MSKLSQENAKAIIQKNIEKIYHLPLKYTYLHQYLRNKYLRETLLKTYNFIKKLDNIVFYKHKYVFYTDTETLTHNIRKKNTGNDVSNRHINLLCCIGFISKQYQEKDNEKYLTKINKRFLEETGRKRPINTFYFRLFTEKELERLEKRAEALAKAKITSGNISYNKLICSGLEDIANEVYFANNKQAPQKKIREFEELLYIIELLINSQGYTTKAEIKDNCLLTDKEIDKLFSIFKEQLKERYCYRSPTKEQRNNWKLTSNKYIFTKKESN